MARFGLVLVCVLVWGMGLMGCPAATTPTPEDTVTPDTSVTADTGSTDASNDTKQPVDTAVVADTSVAETVADVVADTQTGPDLPPSKEAQCDAMALPKMAMNTEGPFGILRHDLADDLTVYLLEGDPFVLSESWTGCDVYMFIPNTRGLSWADETSIWSKDVDTLINGSPLNVHYFFVANRFPNQAMSELTEMQGRIDAVLANYSESKAAYWRDRLHVTGGHGSKLGGWLSQILAGPAGYYGFMIDRRQQIRLLGNFADVTRYKAELDEPNKWPWERNMGFAAHEARHTNFEVTRDAYLASQEDVTIVSPAVKQVLQGTTDFDVEFPDAATMAGFDTFEIDFTMDCPDPALGEFGNCGAWDYLSYIRLMDEESGEWLEVGRFITTYHRQGRYLVDATPLLVHLREGGMRKIRVDVSSQTYLTTVDFRFRNAQKGYTPSAATTSLFGGGGFNSGYNEKYTPIEVAIPEGAKKVEIWAIITGHGMNEGNCAEFCDHHHRFTVNGQAFTRTHPSVGVATGCVPEIENGMTPNQGGTWWFGRGGWCPGQQVEPYVADVTDVVTPGETATVTYEGLLGGGTPPDNSGNIKMSSWLVIYE